MLPKNKSINKSNIQHIVLFCLDIVAQPTEVRVCLCVGSHTHTGCIYNIIYYAHIHTHIYAKFL